MHIHTYIYIYLSIYIYIYIHIFILICMHKPVWFTGDPLTDPQQVRASDVAQETHSRPRAQDHP